MRKILKIFPATFIILFLGGLLGFWIYLIKPWNRTLDNFINLFAMMCILYFPIWLGTLGEERAENFPRLAKYMNDKIVVSLIIIIWIITAIFGLSLIEFDI
mgnify:CR=1 FL=1